MNSVDISAEKIFLEQAEWIWGASQVSDSFTCFRRAFRFSDMEAGECLKLVISADTDFVAWVNGFEVGRGQFSDWLETKTWSSFSVPAHLLNTSRENVLAVLVFYAGIDSSTYVAGPPGLRAVLAGTGKWIATRADGLWQVAPHPAYRNGRAERMTLQTGLTFQYDAREEEAWQEPEMAEKPLIWNSARAVARAGALARRPLPSLILGSMQSVRIASQGVFFEEPGAEAKSDSVADRMAARALRPKFPWRIFSNQALRPQFACLDADETSPDMGAADAEYSGAPRNAGIFLNSDADSEPLQVAGLKTCGGAVARYLIVDLGVEMVGLLELEVDAEEGTILEIAHGEHLEDGRVRMKNGTRRFADRYICGSGRKHFQMPFRRIGARYLEVHISGSGEIRIHHLGLREVQYPENTATQGTFITDDPLASRAWEVAVRTLRLCRHDHYEDCPWREQAMYAQDSRLQALYGYHAFGDYPFAEVSLRLMAQGFDSERGLLPLMSPGRCAVNIPAFTLSWIGAIAEHWLYSGDGKLYAEFSAVVDRILEAAMARKHAATDLYLEPSEPDIWNFYEWVPGLCGSMGASSGTRTSEISAPYNLLLHEALRAAVWMARQAGATDKATTLEHRRIALAEAGRKSFWDASARIWRSTLSLEKTATPEKPSHEYVQALATVEWGKMPGDVRTGKSNPCMLSSLLTLVRAEMTGSREDRSHLCRRLETIWGDMLFSGATTFWETSAGACDFDFAGSLCHGWSALPVWFYSSIILGVSPLQPGFREFAVQIYPYRFSSGQGRIPTPFGAIELEWKKRDAGLEVEIHSPEECRPRLRNFPEVPLVSARWNGNLISDGNFVPK